MKQFLSSKHREKQQDRLSQITTLSNDLVDSCENGFLVTKREIRQTSKKLTRLIRKAVATCLQHGYLDTLEFEHEEPLTDHKGAVIKETPLDKMPPFRTIKKRGKK